MSLKVPGYRSHFFIILNKTQFFIIVHFNSVQLYAKYIYVNKPRININHFIHTKYSFIIVVI